MARRKQREGQSLHKVLGVPGALQHRLRQRRLVHLLRPGRRRASALGLTPARLHADGPALRHHRLVVRRGDGDAAGGRRLVELRAARLQRVRQLRRRLGADARLHRDDRHLGVLRAQLPRRLLAGPQDLAVQHHRRHRRHHLPRRHQRHRHQGGGAAQHRPGRAGPRHPGPHHDHRRCCCCFAPRLLIEQVHLWTAPTLHQFIYAISIGTIAYTGIETISNMAEEAANPDRDVPRAINIVLVTVIVVYIGMSLVALSAMPVGSNVLRVDPRTGYVVPVEVKPGKIEGTYVLASDPLRTRLPPDREQKGSRAFMPPAQTKPTGAVIARWRSGVHASLRHASGQQLHRGPGAGYRALHPRQPGVAAGHPRRRGSASWPRPSSSSPPTRASSACRGSPTRSVSTARSRRSWDACTPSASRRTSPSSCSASWPASSSCPAARSSLPTCTPSAP